MFKICGINPGEFILDGKPLAEKGAAVKETVVINSVARKVDVDKEILPPNKLNYFKAKKEHIVDGISYYVSTRYNREQGIAQLEKMLVLCEGSVNAFVITAKPEKKTKPALTLEEVRAVLADKSRTGHTAEIRELLKKYGASKLSLVDPKHYEALLREAEVL